jgi:uncharacterized protein involved in type VI secretion and phage assembly
MTALFDQSADGARTDSPKGPSIAVGIVTGNIDTPMDGKVLVRVPDLGRELWARLSGAGAGDGAGLYYVPRVDDEVLLAFAGGDPNDAYLIAGLWNGRDRIPVDDPITALTTRVLRSGVTAGTGHEIELDDLKQSVTITTSTGQKVKLDPTGIELTNMAGTVKVSLNNATQAVTLKAAASISLEAPKITIKGATVEINGSATTTVKSAGVVNVTGSLIKLN